MASEEPLFDPSLKKKKKKKTVAFSEDPLGADADPTTPAPIDDIPTVHEQMVQNQTENGSAKNGVVDEEEDFKAMFGDVKKKKKKKDIPMDLPDESSLPAADDMDFSDIKKKKKKKDIPLELPDEASGTSTPIPDADDMDFSDIKKKKKKSKKAAYDLEAFEKELGEQDNAAEEEDGADFDDDDADLGEDVFAGGGAAGETATETGQEAWLNTDRDYTYSELLRRFYTSLHASNPALLSASGRRYTLAPPSIHREGKKSIFANISDICKRMHRQPDHIIQFLFAELGTTGSVDGSGRLVIKGRFSQKQIENVLRRYIVEYVTCKTCKSPDTLLEKENRIDFVSCQSCGSRRSVSAIKSGFKAQIGKRSRNKTG